MKQINAIIVDDEATASHTLRGMLADFCPTVNVIQVADTIEEAVRAAEQYRPEIVFLDIEMPPYGTGFDFLRLTRHLNFGIIFTTAYPHYAVQAINNVHPWAYLIKPYKTVELVQAISNATAKISQIETQAINRQRGFILGDMRKGSVVVRFNDLIYCHAEDSCVIFHVQREGKVEHHSMYRSLKDVEAELPDATFCRVHHSCIVNMGYIQRYERIGRGGKIYLDFDFSVDLSAQRLGPFIQHFNHFLQGSVEL